MVADNANEKLIAQKTCNNIMNLWGLTNDMKSALLPPIDHPEFLDRASYLLNIHAQLRTLFSNPKNIYGFMKMNNNDPLFSGSTPLGLIIKEGTEGFRLVFNYLEKIVNSS